MGATGRQDGIEDLRRVDEFARRGVGAAAQIAAAFKALRAVFDPYFSAVPYVAKDREAARGTGRDAG